MRTIHMFDRETGRYLRTVRANDAVKDRDGNIVFGVLSDNMTEVAPPECPRGYSLRWTGSAWEAVKDPESLRMPAEEEWRAPPTATEKAEELRAVRDGLIRAVMWRVERYMTQKDLGIATTDNEERYMAVLSYIEALRKVPEQSGFPDEVTWPEELA